jgi:hypothetical protein
MLGCRVLQDSGHAARAMQLFPAFVRRPDRSVGGQCRTQAGSFGGRRAERAAGSAGGDGPRREPGAVSSQTQRQFLQSGPALLSGGKDPGAEQAEAAQFDAVLGCPPAVTGLTAGGGAQPR